MKDLYEKVHAIIEGIETAEDRAHAKDAIDALISKRLEFIAETHAPKANKWIPVVREMSKPYDHVFVLIKAGAYPFEYVVRVGFYSEYMGWVPGDGEVVAWTPIVLPDAPNESERSCY